MSTKILTDPQLPKDHQQTGSPPRRKETSILPRNSLEIPLLTFESTNTTRGIEKGLRYRAGRLRLCHVREESCPVFFFFPTPRGDREEERVEGAGKCLAATPPPPSTLFSPLDTAKGGVERENREHTHKHAHMACATSIQRHQGPWRDARNGNSVAARRLITEFQGDGSGKGMVLVL